MKKLIIFIGIVLFSGFASTSVHAKEVKLTQEEQIAKLKADYTAQADVVKKNESNLSLLKANKENSDKLTASNKKLTEAETELKKLETKLAETQKKAVTDSYKQDQKTKEVGDAETAVNTQKKSIETMKTERAKNPIKIAENKVADYKNKIT